ncbi:MAG: DNA polymerase III subunit delta [Candidatus Peribacteraceae bacterium]
MPCSGLRMAHDQLHLFTGSNAFALREELRRWKRTFAEKYGDENMLILDGRSLTLPTLLDATATMPFLSEKRLVIVDGFPSIEKEDVATMLSSMHHQVVTLFIEPAPDKRTALAKEMLKVATLHEFHDLAPHELRGWITGTVKGSGKAIDHEAVAELLLIVGSDQQVLSQELAKLLCYVTSTITKQDVQLLAVPSGSQVIWRLTDLLGSGKVHEAVEFIRFSLDRGEDPYTLWSILLNMIKNVVLVSASLRSGTTDDKSIASETGMHFFAVRGLKNLARSLSPEAVTVLAKAALSADIALKTGGHKYTSERPEELICLLERTVLLCAQK